MTTACSTPSTTPSRDVLALDQVVVSLQCPRLAPLDDPSFGATTLKLIEVAGVYNACRCAALKAPEACGEAK